MSEGGALNPKDMHMHLFVYETIVGSFSSSHLEPMAHFYLHDFIEVSFVPTTCKLQIIAVPMFFIFSWIY